MNLTSEKFLKWIKCFLFFALETVYFVYLVLIFAEYNGIDSDYSNLILEASDILNGNFFLSGWNLTGVTFFPTDLVFFTIGVALFGVSVKAYIFAIALMYWMLVLAGFLLIKNHIKVCKSGFWWFVLVVAFPNMFLMSIVRAHTGGIIWCLISLYLLEKKIDKKFISILRYALAICLFSMAAMGDAVSIIIIIGPLLLVSLMGVVNDYIHYRKFNVENIINSLTAVFSLILSIVFDKIYFLIGGANKNSFLQNSVFTSFESLEQYVSLYISSLLRMFNADFFGEEIISARTILYISGICIILVGIIFIGYQIVCLLKDKEYDIISIVLGIGLVLISVAYIFGGMIPIADTARYYATAPVLVAVIIVRTGTTLLARMDNKRKEVLIKGVSIVLTLVVLAIEFKIPTFSINHNETEVGLVKVLQDNNLTKGYGEFWTSSITTVYSEESVCVRAISIEPEGATAFDWFNKEDWYQEGFNFVLLSANGTGLYFSIEDAINTFGEPCNIIEYDKYVIYVYDYDISSKLNMDIESNTHRPVEKLVEVMQAG